MVWHWPRFRARPALLLLVLSLVVGLAQGALLRKLQIVHGGEPDPLIVLQQLTGALAAWAALPVVQTIVLNAQRFTRADSKRQAWLRWSSFVAMHVLGYLAFSAAHIALIRLLRGALFMPDAPLSVRILWEMQNDLVVYTAVAAVLTLLASWRERDRAALQNAALETELARSHLAALTAQVDPHFLYNALNTLSAVMYEDLGKAERLLASLGTMLRTTLGGGEASWTLCEERAHSERYFELMSARFGERLSLKWQQDPDLEEAKLPRYAVQTLVENAIKHNATRVEPLSIHVEIRAHGARIEVTVDDDGVGFAGRAAGQSGLCRLERTLELLHGGDASLALASSPSGGARIRFQVPR